MSFFYSKKLNKIFFILGFLFCFPFIAQAGVCTSNGGTCLPYTSCSVALSGGAYDGDCGLGEKCCASTGTTTPIAATPTSDTYEEGSTGGFLFLKGHLVPCGRKTDDGNTPGNDETKSCTLCHLFLLLKNIFDLMLSLIVIVAILTITIGGVIYIVSTGNPTLTGIAKNIINKTLIGFALMLIGWLLVFTLLTFLSSTGNMIGNGTGWWNFTCNETSLFDSAYGSPLLSPTADTSLSAADSSSYTYDNAGIASQTADASTPLKNLLDCMEPKLASDAKRISSISDSEGITNCLPSTYTNDCAHTKNSCHYGGRSASCIGESYAVDFGNESYQSQINSAALSCNPSAYVLLESSHVHVSVGAISGCGCN